MILLHQWLIRRDVKGNWYFIGFKDGGETARLSTPIVKFDVQTNRGRTASGRIYQLFGPASEHPDTELAWLCFRAAYGITEQHGAPS